MQLAGRDRELELTAGALDDVRGGRTPLLRVVGEAGIGKTALLGALAAGAAERRLDLIEGRAVEHEREVPYGFALDVFGALDEELAVLLCGGGAGPEQRFHIHRALRTLLARER